MTVRFSLLLLVATALLSWSVVREVQTSADFESARSVLLMFAGMQLLALLNLLVHAVNAVVERLVRRFDPPPAAGEVA